MIEIVAQQRPPLATLLVVIAAALALAVVAMRMRSDGWRRWPDARALGIALLIGFLLTGVSAVASSDRHAGTGTEHALGWPRVVYARWSSWEAPEEREGVRWRGIAENIAVYSAGALLLVALVRRLTPPDRV